MSTSVSTTTSASTTSGGFFQQFYRRGAIIRTVSLTFQPMAFSQRYWKFVLGWELGLCQTVSYYKKLGMLRILAQKFLEIWVSENPRFCQFKWGGSFMPCYTAAFLQCSDLSAIIIGYNLYRVKKSDKFYTTLMKFDWLRWLVIDLL